MSAISTFATGETGIAEDVGSAPGIQGEGAVTLGALTSSGAGFVGTTPIVGQSNVTLGALTSTGTGQVSVNGVGAVTLGALLSTGSGFLGTTPPAPPPPPPPPPTGATGITFSAAANDLLPYVPGCPIGLMVRALRDASIEFCIESQCLVTGSEVTFTATAGTPSWDFASDQIIDVVEARIDGKPIPVLRINDPLADDLDDDVYCIRFAEPNNLIITPAPTANLDVDLLIVTAPSPQSESMHASLWQRHHRALRDGALAELYEIPGRAWSNAQLSTYHRGKFNDAMQKAKSHVNRNVTKTARRLRVRPA